MNYLRISNSGLICAEDLMLIGSSTKREQTGKIGMFGSGWKYALAWLLRNETTPIIFSGENRIDVDFDMTMHRDNPVKVITVNGQKTSLTTEMGPKWTGWMALREVLSNAIDEGDHSITTAWLPELKGVSNNTVIYIPMSSELSDVMLKFDSYFAFNRKDSYIHPKCRFFFKTEVSNLNIYRKGIRCFDTNERTKVDFDFNDLHISEDRLTSEYWINDKIKDIISEGIPTHIFKRLLSEERMDWLPYSINDKVMANLVDLVNEGCNFTTPTLQKLGGVLFSLPDSIVIPAEYFKKLQDLGLVKSPFEVFGDEETFIRTDEKNTEGVNYYLSAFNINCDVRSGKCESDVFVNNGVVYIKDTTKLDDKTLAAKAIKRFSIDYLVEKMN